MTGVPYPQSGAAPVYGAPPRDAQYKWVYVWQWPIRAMHWLAAIAIVALVITGFYIGQPYFILPTDEGQQSPFIMGYMRFVHFVGAGALIATAIVRIYWFFAGNKYERLPALFPVRGRDFRNLIRMTRYYLFIGRDADHPPVYIGHHPMQQLSYTLVYLLTAVMIITGFALYGDANPGGAIYRIFNPVTGFLGGAPIARVIHHVATWFYLIFIPMHIYLASRADVMEKEGTMSSIFSGGRWLRADHRYEDE